MGRDTVTATLESARRLTLTKQHLAGPLPSRVSSASLLSVVRELGYVQWDPVNIVAPSHVLSLWSRLGSFDVPEIDRLLWKEKRLLLHWTPMASLVLTEDYPLFLSLMRRYPQSLTSSWGAQRARAGTFLAKHSALRNRILEDLERGPLRVGEFRDHGRTKRDDGEWAPASDVSLMLFHLLMKGEVMVVAHRGNQNLWGLSEQFLPSWTKRTVLSEEEFERQAAQRAIRALGTASLREIRFYFVRGRYQNLDRALESLMEQGTIHPIVVDGLPRRDVRYIHQDDLPLLDSLGGSAWQPRTSLLPPFDNLVGGAAFLKRLFGFEYVREQFLPKEKRRFGTYVLPIVHGERLIGRVDPKLDRDSGKLLVHAVHAEPGAPTDRAVGEAIAETISRLGDFLGASEVCYSARVPTLWKGALR